MKMEIPYGCLETNEVDETQRKILIQTGFYLLFLKGGGGGGADVPDDYFLFLFRKRE